MENFTSKIGSCTFLTFLIIGILDIGLLMFWGLSGIWIPFLVFTCIFVVFVVPPFFFTQYSLTQDYLKITCFWVALGKKIKYEDIVSVVPCTSAKLSAKLANECIRIVYLKKGKTKDIYVSPALNDRFINQLTDNVLFASVIKEKNYNESMMTLEGIQQPDFWEVKKPKKQTEEKVEIKAPVEKTATKKTVRKTTKTPAKKAGTKTVKKTVKKTK